MTVAAVFLQPGWADWEAGSVLALLRRDLGVQIEVATPDGEPQTSIGGLLVAADYRFDDPALSDADVYLLIGSDAWSDYRDEVVLGMLRQAVADGKIVGAICGATVAMARARLLDGRAQTANSQAWLEGEAPGYAGAAGYVDQPRAVTSGKVVTASGLAPVSFAAAVARLIAPEAEAEIATFEGLFAKEFATP
ncbi:MAG: DJ-1/PfpI family protein [bacterium]|nr:DJ-1/PfpI family protein [bacterium]